MAPSRNAQETCFNCRDLIPDGYRSGNTYNTRFTCKLNELRSAATNGCEICALVQAATEQLFDTEARIQIEDLSLTVTTLPDSLIGSLFQHFKKDVEVDRYVFVTKKSSMTINIRIRDDPVYDNVINGRTYDVILQSQASSLFSISHDLLTSAFTDGSQQLPWVQLCNAKPTTFFGDTGSKPASDWAQARIKECRTWHPECRVVDLSTSSTKPVLPKRIVEIVEDRCVRLREPVNERAAYACLSHCWGGAKPLITRTATLEHHLDEIAWNEIPKTFQDAITFLRYLKIRYIWIDSLCIIQDSEEDWLEHSGIMADIYSSAYITIAATRAANSSVGLFTSSHEVELRCGSTQLIICEQPKHAHPGSVTNDTFPLLTRGWVAQEMLLSPRVLHFCNGELVYECMRGPVCSCCSVRTLSHGDYGRKNPVWSMNAKKDSNLSKLRSLLGYNSAATNDSSTTQSVSKSPPEEPHFSEWRQMLMNYSDLFLTFEKDRFPAISGLARCFSSKFNTTYTAGLWVENLRNDLLWAMPHRSKPEKRRLGAGAPTWSWANCGSNTTTYMCETGAHLYFTVVAVDCVPISEHDPFGQLKSATLTLRGSLIPLVLERSKKGYNAQSDGRRGIEVEPDLNLDSIVTEANEQGRFFGLPIVRQQIETRGLVLHRRDDSCYERVGQWFCSSKEGYYQRFDPPEWWRAEALHEVFETMKLETVVVV